MSAAARALGVVPLLAALAIASACGGGGNSDATIPIHYSHYMNEFVTARVGQPITITLRNDDPIEHEWIVGTDAVHERHRTGTEPDHGTIPTEVTIPALSTRVTTVTFRERGDYNYICHLPGHEQYGMVGTLHVVASGSTPSARETRSAQAPAPCDTDRLDARFCQGTLSVIGCGGGMEGKQMFRRKDEHDLEQVARLQTEVRKGREALARRFSRIDGEVSASSHENPDRRTGTLYDVFAAYGASTDVA